ncbi:MAG: S-methyl-5-thioribose-1-phosphate isomerase [Alicyclobacillaceae bacterium]|nr:S-methyl-5-thioribose-1-phosphate isomerase [Alicyclobacillaceae bacterium]
MKALEWTRDGLRLLDQRRLPHEQRWVVCRNADEAADAIRQMVVRGAPAIAAAAAWGVVLEARRLRDEGADSDRLLRRLEAAMERLAASRPTAVNLFWALDRMREALDRALSEAPGQAVEAGRRTDRTREAGVAAFVCARLEAEARAICDEDARVCRRIGRLGADLFPQGSQVRVLTHCNTGSLATVEYGTALGIVRALAENGRLAHVWVDETRPYLQGARLTAFELQQEGIPHTLVTDSMAGYLMHRGLVDAVVVGADRIARNGDTANKIGTYSLAVLAHHHGVPFYVAAPVSSFDMSIATGMEIPIEERSPEEVLTVLSQRIAPEGTPALHPAFDVTPHMLITAIVTEAGVIERPDARSVGKVVAPRRKVIATGVQPDADP